MLAAIALLACSTSGGASSLGPEDGGRARDATSGCGAGLTSCGGTCLDTSSDRANCGACGKTCTDGLICSDATCVSSGTCTGASCSAPPEAGIDGATAADTGVNGDDSGPGGDDGSAGGDAASVQDTGASACPPLASRVTFTTVSVAPAAVSAGFPIMLSTLADGTSQVAWTDGALVHVTPLDGTQQRAGADVTVTGSEVRGFVAQPASDALLVVRNDEMLLVSVGASPFETVIVGGGPHTGNGERWIDSWPHEGRLVWDGSSYHAYFGCSENWGSIGNHQQDYLWTLSASGAIVNPPGQYDWLCGHSLDLLLGYAAGATTTSCLSDCNYDTQNNPNPGIYEDGKRVFTASGDCAGNAGAVLGGLVPGATGAYLSFGGDHGGTTYDVGLLLIPTGGSPGPVTWLTNTPSVAESEPRLAAYGTNLLAAWEAGGATELAVVATSGAILDGPVAIPAPAKFGDGDDFVTFPDGDVGWAGRSAKSELTVMRVALCQ